MIDFHEAVFKNLEYSGIISKDSEFEINEALISKFIDLYAELSKTKGKMKGSNLRYAKKLAAISFIKFKLKHNLPVKEGFVYFISNPAWHDQYKIGMSQLPKDRLAQYQTYSPLRDYKLHHWSYWLDKREGEKLVHSLFDDVKDYEWVNLPESKLHKYLEIINSKCYIK